ncbi:hypothetical protein [Bradyrhizobium sp. USDA 3650]
MKDAAKKRARGRPFGDPDARRSYRFVMRMNPDLADVLDLLADESGLSRSLFVERVLISFVNQDPRIQLNHIGRKVDTMPTGPAPPGSLASFGAQWRRWHAMKHDVLGEDAPTAYGAAEPSFDDFGRDARGHGHRQEQRPPVPDHLTHKAADKIIPHKGGRRKAPK